MNKVMYRTGYEILSEHKRELQSGRIVITNQFGEELQIVVEDDGTFEVYMDDIAVQSYASNHIALRSIRYRRGVK